MKSADVRKTFLDFFHSKEHKIVPSAPMVVKDDPTLMFTNAGMNQFKDIFLGNMAAKYNRIADTQKCLRVSGKHNDLEEVGHDTYHHTMFEMLGNWSFGNYFKKEAIEWAWELLTEVYRIDPENLYATVFEGDSPEGLPMDEEAYSHWTKILPGDRVLKGSKKDNFWEMGDTGPCGPCSEIHIDIRDKKEKDLIPGRELVNKGHPHVIEIWNLVFIEFNRQSDGRLAPLPQKHVDTGMGFERLTMVLQGKKSNYDTDIFQPVIQKIGALSGIKYGDDAAADIAMRVIADHLRAISFAIADGQLPSNTGAGYVIRRILRRAVRYGFTFLDRKEPFINQLVPVLAGEMGHYFPELVSQRDLIQKVILEEEGAFLRTLSQGIKRFDQYIEDHPGKKPVDGSFAFELFDTYGFPVDLTRLMANEKGLEVDMEGFQNGLNQQKDRSRQAAQVTAGDWNIVRPSEEPTEFVGHATLVTSANVVMYRQVKAKDGSYHEVVLDRTPFYAESGGQVGDRGVIESGTEKINVLDTYKENELIIHKAAGIFSDPAHPVTAIVDGRKRRDTARNHSATHLMHAALRSVLGAHVEQKGSLVDENHLRFDFSHFSKMTEEQVTEVERLVNEKIRENIPNEEMRDVPLDDAREMGAMALFGEKYGEHVRVIAFNRDYSVELCGGTHVQATGEIGFFKITSESAIAAGIRRIEAVTGRGAEDLVLSDQKLIGQFQEVLKNDKDPLRALKNLAEENRQLQKKLGDLSRYQLQAIQKELLERAEKIGNASFIGERLDIELKEAKDLAFSMRGARENLVLLIATTQGDKANLTLMLNDELVRDHGLDAGRMIREIAREINGGGGGQPHFATAGGNHPGGVEKAFEKAREILKEL